jgi:hypothetical protein
MDAITHIFAAFGLSGSAGLNAYLPLLVVSLTARFTNLIELGEPWNTLEHPIVIGVLAILLVIETFADKVPAINHINDVIQTFVRPTAGAILFAASTSVVTKMDPILALVLGLLAAGAVHGAKSVVLRPTITAVSGGTANPIVSIAEDVVALAISVIAVVLPVLISAIIILLTALILWWLWRRRARAAKT